jgi:hypothetical protein
VVAVWVCRCGPRSRLQFASVRVKRAGEPLGKQACTLARDALGSP